MEQWKWWTVWRTTRTADGARVSRQLGACRARTLAEAIGQAALDFKRPSHVTLRRP